MKWKIEKRVSKIRRGSIFPESEADKILENLMITEKELTRIIAYYLCHAEKEWSVNSTNNNPDLLKKFRIVGSSIHDIGVLKVINAENGISFRVRIRYEGTDEEGGIHYLGIYNIFL